MKLPYKFYILLFLFNISLKAQNYQQNLSTIDIEHYKLAIEVNDSTNSINAKMAISLKFKKNVTAFNLDFVQKDSTGKGMTIEYILQNNDTVPFIHSNNTIKITTKKPNLTDVFTYTIKYNGVPKDGLIISENIYGDRTFFGDNWPNRAHNWFPCIDHPSDKATIEYIIKAPDHYQAIANGYQVEETNLTDNLKEYHWVSTVPLPTKVMVIGIARFAVQNIGETHNIPVSTWVYPQTKEQGFYDYATAKDILDFFIENIGEYPYEKLANVQSKTRFGGMENAGNIFYFEQSVTGERKHNDLIAHEIAHQWFGDSATEINWPHLWLSEGFATYLTDLYILKTEGETAFKERMQSERTTVLNFYKKQQTPVVDTQTTNYMRLLNANSYQKGAWVLHMLKNKLGDEIFWKGIRKYYETYKFKNASTNNFKNCIAEVSGKNLDTFFNQWLYKSGHPIIKTSWISSNNKLKIIIDQTQETTFQFPLEIELFYTDGTSEIKTIEVVEKSYPYEIDVKGEVKALNFDPNTKLLFELI
ncbi:M1 family metallopeptidase [Lutibacter sp. B1]|uniref:M1 family metallopeptidase n=1 Tax=Lutibacter sp. B1 TaxID=2725996 RepID=UPI00145672F1|nr:M1 family metallopeptidase [Lutibacter sp. B1]NLP58613.1 M1 family metallopeptidase [Lutibacter sp. B1]